MHPCSLAISADSSLAQALPGARRVGFDRIDSARYHQVGAARQSEAGLTVFQYSMGGCGRIAVGGTVHPVPAGSGFLCKLYDPDIVYYYDPDEHTPWEFFYIVFRGTEDWVREIAVTRGYVHPLPQRDPALAPFLAMLERCEPVTLDAATMLSLTSGLFVALCRGNETKGNPTRRIVDRAIAVMQGRLDSADGMAEIARRVGVTPEHLARVFRKEMGISPLTHFHRQKIRQACTLLTNERIPIKEIAAAVGMENVSNFTRFFGRHIGMTPGDFRARRGGVCFPADLW